MDIELRDEPLNFDLYGLSGEVAGQDYSGTGKWLMDELWGIVRGNELPHKGKNFWVYWSNDRMSTCVELKDSENVGVNLEHLPVALRRYLYYRYVGPYHRLGGVHRAMDAAVASRGLTDRGPRVEKYGDWTGDENTTVTEVFVGIE